MIKRIIESKTLTKHISCKCKYKCDRRKNNSDQSRNDDNCWCKYKKLHACEKEYILYVVLKIENIYQV